MLTSLTKKSTPKSRSHRNISWTIPCENSLQYETWQTSERFERGRKKKLKTFLSRSNVSYTNPGKNDHVYVSKIDGECRCKERLYLLWNLCNLLNIINGPEKVDVTYTFYQNFEKLLTFSQLYDFVKYHKEYCYNQYFPHGSCLCEIVKIASCLQRDWILDCYVHCQLTRTSWSRDFRVTYKKSIA